MPRSVGLRCSDEAANYPKTIESCGLTGWAPEVQSLSESLLNSSFAVPVLPTTCQGKLAGRLASKSIPFAKEHGPPCCLLLASSAAPTLDSATTSQQISWSMQQVPLPVLRYSRPPI